MFFFFLLYLVRKNLSNYTVEKKKSCISGQVNKLTPPPPPGTERQRKCVETFIKREREQALVNNSKLRAFFLYTNVFFFVKQGTMLIVVLGKAYEFFFCTLKSQMKLKKLEV